MDYTPREKYAYTFEEASLKSGIALNLLRRSEDWHPEEGDQVTGVILGIRPREGPYVPGDTGAGPRPISVLVECFTRSASGLSTIPDGYSVSYIRLVRSELFLQPRRGCRPEGAEWKREPCLMQVYTYGVSFEEYCSWPIRVSTLNACRKSLKHGRFLETNPGSHTSSKVQAFGTAFHTAVLEPASFDISSIPLSKIEAETLSGMLESIQGDRTCAELLANAQRQGDFDRVERPGNRADV